MINLILTASIMFVTSSAQMENCGQWIAIEGQINGCYVAETNHIYVDNDTNVVGDRPQDFVLYHEIGHSLFLDGFDVWMFKDKEVMADQFGLFIYGKKYPYLKDLVSKDRQFYFDMRCQDKCVEQILAIKLPNSHWDKTFLVRN